ncbi:hypothetical protein M0802_009794 [Mischocyttarus mexicanus]|nr:hypothetical protein M0802_009794 [Mischocyttarus mexicanus]
MGPVRSRLMVGGKRGLYYQVVVGGSSDDGGGSGVRGGRAKGQRSCSQVPLLLLPLVLVMLLMLWPFGKSRSFRSFRLGTLHLPDRFPTQHVQFAGTGASAGWCYWCWPPSKTILGVVVVVDCCVLR